jgi:hypothetical protein
MTIEELRQSDKQYLTPNEVAPLLKSSPQAIRCQAHADPAKLGFPVIVIGTRVRIPLKAFLALMEGVTA